MTTFLLVLAALIVAFLVYVMLRPNEFRIERSSTIERKSPAEVFALLNDFHQWQKWSPWEAMDPNLQRSYSGSDTGVGAVYAWKGNKKVGEGRMEITESKPAAFVRLKLDFIAPMKANNMTDFNVMAQGTGTRIIWSMYGPSPFMSKLFGAIVSIDKMVGKDFEKGLANIEAELNR